MATAYKSLGWKVARAVKDKTGGKCYYCGCELPEDTHIYNEQGFVMVSSRNWHIDHMLPRSKGGTNNLTNLVPSCAQCNIDKRDMTDSEFIAARAK